MAWYSKSSSELSAYVLSAINGTRRDVFRSERVAAKQPDEPNCTERDPLFRWTEWPIVFAKLLVMNQAGRIRCWLELVLRSLSIILLNVLFCFSTERRYHTGISMNTTAVSKTKQEFASPAIWNKGGIKSTRNEIIIQTSDQQRSIGVGPGVDTVSRRLHYTMAVFERPKSFYYE